MAYKITLVDYKTNEVHKTVNLTDTKRIIQYSYGGVMMLLEKNNDGFSQTGFIVRKDSLSLEEIEYLKKEYSKKMKVICIYDYNANVIYRGLNIRYLTPGLNIDPVRVSACLSYHVYKQDGYIVYYAHDESNALKDILSKYDFVNVKTIDIFPKKIKRRFISGKSVIHIYNVYTKRVVSGKHLIRMENRLKLKRHVLTSALTNNRPYLKDGYIISLEKKKTDWSNEIKEWNRLYPLIYLFDLKNEVLYSSYCLKELALHVNADYSSLKFTKYRNYYFSSGYIVFTNNCSGERLETYKQVYKIDMAKAIFIESKMVRAVKGKVKLPSRKKSLYAESIMAYDMRKKKLYSSQVRQRIVETVGVSAHRLKKMLEEKDYIRNNFICYFDSDTSEEIVDLKRQFKHTGVELI